MEAESGGSTVEDDINHVLSVGSTSRGLQTTYLIISLVLAVGCALLLIFLVWKKEYLQKPSHYLRCNLAVDDIIFTGCLIPVRIYALFQQDASGGQVRCAAGALVAPACLMYMYGTYLMMAVDLYYFVCDPLHYHAKVTTKRVVLGILAFRAFSLFGGLAPVVFGGLPKHSLRCEIESANSASLSAISKNMNVLFLLLVVLSVLTIYLRVFKEARRQQERDENRDLWVFQTKAFKVMAPHTIVLTAATTTTIFHVATVRAVISEEQMSQRALVITERVALLLFLTLSSVANPIMYSFRLPEFRRACRELCGLPTNPPPAVPPRWHRQDDAELAAIDGPGHGAPASESVPAQATGLTMQPTAKGMALDQAHKQTTQTDKIPGTAPRTGRETASGQPFQLTVRADVHPEPTPRPGDEETTAAHPGELHSDAEAEDIPTITLDAETDEATAGHTLEHPPPRLKLAWAEDTRQ